MNTSPSTLETSRRFTSRSSVTITPFPVLCSVTSSAIRKRDTNTLSDPARPEGPGDYRRYIRERSTGRARFQIVPLWRTSHQGDGCRLGYFTDHREDGVVLARAWLRHELKRMQPSDAGTLPGVKKVLPCTLGPGPRKRGVPPKDTDLISPSSASPSRIRQVAIAAEGAEARYSSRDVPLSASSTSRSPSACTYGPLRGMEIGTGGETPYFCEKSPWFTAIPTRPRESI